MSEADKNKPKMKRGKTHQIGWISNRWWMLARLKYDNVWNGKIKQETRGLQYEPRYFCTHVRVNGWSEKNSYRGKRKSSAVANSFELNRNEMSLCLCRWRTRRRVQGNEQLKQSKWSKQTKREITATSILRFLSSDTVTHRQRFFAIELILTFVACLQNIYSHRAQYDFSYCRQPTTSLI